MRGSVRPSISYNGPTLGEEPLYWASYLLLRFLQGLFNHLPPGTFRWEPDEKDTEILITDQAPIQEEVVGRRPAIVVVRGPARFAGLFLDDLVEYNMLSGERLHSDLIPGTLSINCLSKNGLEAQRIAWLCGRGLKEHHRLLLKYWRYIDDTGNHKYTFGFHKIGSIINFGSETSPGSIVAGSGAHEYIMVPGQVPFFLQWTWRTQPLSPPQKEDLGLILGQDRASDAEKPTFDRADEMIVTLSNNDGDEIQVSHMGPGPSGNKVP